MAIGAADLADDLRLGEHQKIVVALQITRMILEARTAEILLVQAIALDHHAPGAVEQENPLPCGAVEPFDAFVARGH